MPFVLITKAQPCAYAGRKSPLNYFLMCWGTGRGSVEGTLTLWPSWWRRNRGTLDRFFTTLSLGSSSGRTFIHNVEVFLPQKRNLGPREVKMICKVTQLVPSRTESTLSVSNLPVYFTLAWDTCLISTHSLPEPGCPYSASPSSAQYRFLIWLPLRTAHGAAFNRPLPVTDAVQI